MSPADSWLLLLAVLVIGTTPVWLLCRYVERRHVPFCACAGCLAEVHALTRNNAQDPEGANHVRVLPIPAASKQED